MPYTKFIGGETKGNRPQTSEFAPTEGTRGTLTIFSNDPTMRFLAPLLMPAFVAFFYGWASVQTMDAARATVNAHQERQADALCDADPSYCGIR